MLISIIVPVYNTANYLPKCIESIIRQTFTEWELLLIDDGSVDGSGLVCDQFSTAHPQIRTYHKNNGGVSSARNYGLSKSKGDWITFVDSDDYIDHNYLKDLISPIQSNEIDFVIGGCCVVTGTSSTRFCLNPILVKTNHIKELFFHNKIGLIPKSLWLFGLPVAKLYSKELIERANLEFNENINYGEDILFNIGYLNQTKKVVAIKESIYSYAIRTSSLSYPDGSITKYLTLISQLEIIRLETKNKFLNFYIKHSINSNIETILGIINKVKIKEQRLTILRQNHNLFHLKNLCFRNFKDFVLKLILILHLFSIYDFTMTKITKRQ